MPDQPSPAAAADDAALQSLSGIERLLQVMARLRDPVSGCAWDREQSFASIAPYTLEEAHEVADAIERQDWAGLKDELGDLLLQVVFHARIAEELGLFAFPDIAEGIAEKMIRRHPHIFTQPESRDPEAQHLAWEAQKAAERAAKAQAAGRPPGALDDVALALPALLRAHKLQKRAARTGFDWPDAAAILPKVDEELAELREAIAAGEPRAMAEEMGDLLFVLANLARRLDLEAETVLRAANAKFTRRFERMEALARERGLIFEHLDLAAQEALWQQVKREEAAGSAEAG